MEFNNCIFLDFDGVLNCEEFYAEKYNHLRHDNIPLYKTVKKYLRKSLKKKEISGIEYYRSETCPKRMELLNNLCKETNSCVVLSASMRRQYSASELQEIFNNLGAKFTILDKTGHHKSRIRGVEIKTWIMANSEKFFGIPYFHFNNYVIIDDDADMLECQKLNFFQTDDYYGLTQDICKEIKRFLK